MAARFGEDLGYQMYKFIQSDARNARIINSCTMFGIQPMMPWMYSCRLTPSTKIMILRSLKISSVCMSGTKKPHIKLKGMIRSDTGSAQIFPKMWKSSLMKILWLFAGIRRGLSLRSLEEDNIKPSSIKEDSKKKILSLLGSQKISITGRPNP